MRYYILITFVLLATFLKPCELFAQEYSISTQKDCLHQYAGHWVSTIHPNTDSIAPIPHLKMINTSNFNHHSLNVEVLQFKDDLYQPILQELIGYDILSQKIFASGHNAKGEFFTGKGGFISPSEWHMQDSDLKGNKTISVVFNFMSQTDVVVEGFNTDNKSIWKTRYIKQNPKDKNIGIQLVSVKEAIEIAPLKTLEQLSRMGFSYVETFVYDKGLFYGMSPAEFKQEVEKVGMKFIGSMTFYDKPSKDKWDEALNWWNKCIIDHKKAGVSYISTSNHQLKQVKTKAELLEYCDYYNKVGELCAENGINFVYHNHSDEFLEVEDVIIYDYYLQNTNPQWVFFQPDFYWMHIGGANPIFYFKKYPNRFISWHVKDFQELGRSGKIDFDTIFIFSKIAGLKHVIAEVEDYNYPPIYSINLAWEYLYYNSLKDE
ncbi:sugar phosphate isomerase/epimerase family protein [Labilibacter marinus]|uniref:sugar phosphate isomerase/epimerase family protein n=1 Tax=Labilibacter marinus TaxID=1477105 RepID=UPI0009F81B31|nr:TIM barrel protein [Labilibacter marinus]